MTTSTQDRDFVRGFINDNCIARVAPGSRELPAHPNTGGFYTWQFYLRRALLDPRVLAAVTRDFLALYEEPLSRGAVQLCGVESASTPLLTAFVLACGARGWGVNAFSIRKSAKAYGLRNWIEGRAVPELPAMLIDDIISGSHATAIHGATVLARHGLTMANCTYAVVFKVPDNRASIRLLGHTVRVSSMFRLHHFNLELEEYELHKAGKVRIAKL